MKRNITRLWVSSSVKYKIKLLSAKEGLTIQNYLEKHFGGEDNEFKGRFRGMF